LGLDVAYRYRAAHQSRIAKNNAKKLNYFDAVIFASTTGELDVDGSQKQDLMSFIKKDGKGFVGITTRVFIVRTMISRWPGARCTVKDGSLIPHSATRKTHGKTPI